MNQTVEVRRAAADKASEMEKLFWLEMLMVATAFLLAWYADRFCCGRGSTTTEPIITDQRLSTSGDAKDGWKSSSSDSLSKTQLAAGCPKPDVINDIPECVILIEK